MTACVALLRAVNVAGTGKLAMTQLKAMSEEIGFANVKTYIASGNVIFTSALPAARVQAALEAKLAVHAGRPVGVFIRTSAEMASVRDSNPFASEPGNHVVAIFLGTPPGAQQVDGLKHQAGETLKLGQCEIYVHHPDGQGHSRLVIPNAACGTARNMNTVTKLAEMAAALGD